MKRSKLVKLVAKNAAASIADITPDSGIVTKEGINNFFTAADIASEKTIIETIKQYFPDDVILSEETESNLSDQVLLTAEHLWVIDPLDGTNNFKNQRGYSAISVGYVEKGEIKAGAIYNFQRDELFYAQAGQGASLNGQKITVGVQTDLQESVVATDPYYTHEVTRKNLELLLKINPTFVLIKGSGCLMMCEIAAGRTDLYFHTSLQPWDNAAAFLIIKEAGGTIKGLKGEEITFLSPTVVVGNSQLVDQFVSAIS